MNTTAIEVNSKDLLLSEKFEIHRDFTKIFIDAFVLVNTDRKVLKFNQMFCTMLGIKAIEVKKAKTIDELIKTEVPCSAANAIDTIMNSIDPQRIDEVKATHSNDNGVPLQLIIASYPYFDGQGNFLGACILMRDVTAENNLQGKYHEKSVLAITDPLTSLYTRRYFEEWLDNEVIRCKNFNQKFFIGVLMFDLDKFKSVNDLLGHQAGDYVLTETARVLKDSCRKNDIIGRYGGEEIIVLLLNSTEKGCCFAAEKLRLAISNHPFMYQGARIHVTTSIGISSFTSTAETRIDVIARADACLYAAKNAGRNICFCDFGEGRTDVKDFLSEKNDMNSESSN